MLFKAILLKMRKALRRHTAGRECLPALVKMINVRADTNHAQEGLDLPTAGMAESALGSSPKLVGLIKKGQATSAVDAVHSVFPPLDAIRHRGGAAAFLLYCTTKPSFCQSVQRFSL